MSTWYLRRVQCFGIVVRKWELEGAAFESLAVIAIIGLLAALLLPTLASTKDVWEYEDVRAKARNRLPGELSERSSIHAAQRGAEIARITQPHVTHLTHSQ